MDFIILVLTRLRILPPLHSQAHLVTYTGKQAILMKYITTILTILLLALVFSCHKDPPIPTPQSRAQQALMPPALFSTNFDTAIKTASVIVSSGTIEINATDSIHRPCGLQAWIDFKFKAHDTGTYTLSYANKGTAYIGNPCDHLPPPDLFSTDSTHTGIVVLTQYDSVSHLLSGHFKFEGRYFYGPRPWDTVTQACTGTFSNLHW